MRGSIVGFVMFAFAAGVVLISVKAPINRGPDPVIGYDQPLANAGFRYQKRLSADGTMPDNAWMLAKSARDRMVAAQGQQRGGVGPGSWTFLGPTNVGGRIRAIAIHPTQPNTMWIGGNSGGVWKTTDGGATWLPMDDFLPGIAVNCMVLDKSNPNVLYVGTGEGFFETEEGSTNTACIRGAGIFKSTDGGVHWVQIPTTNNPDFYFVNRLAIHPTNPNILLAAASTGIWRSTDAGATWNPVYDAEWMYDVDFHPTDGSKAIAGSHAQGAFYSNDGGLTWTRSTSISAHRAEVAYAPSNPTTVYATVSSGSSIRVWRSTNGGVTYTQQAANTISTYEAYNNALWVNPTNANTILYGGVYLYRSTNAGGSRSQAFSDIHPDIHEFVTHPQFDGVNNKTVFVGTDGGLYRISDFAGGNANLFFYNGLGITQFYGAAISPQSGRIMGGTQDNGTRLYTGNIANWTQSAGGDGGYAAVDPLDSNFFYGCIYWAYQFRSTTGGGSTHYIYNTANPITDAGNADNVNFINRFVIDHNNPNRMLVAAQRLWRSNNVKASSPDWFVIKPTIAPSGRGRGVGGGNAHMVSNNPYNISNVAIATGNSDIIYVGHNNGQLYRTSNGTATSPTWTRIDQNGPLPARWLSWIVIDPANPNHVYVSFMGFHDDSIFETTDGGQSWTDISSGRLIPASVNCISMHPTRAGWLYAGTDLGLFTSSDNGLSWTATTDGPGTVPIEEIFWRNNSTILLATYGRGIYSASIDSAWDVFKPDSFTVTRGIKGNGTLSSTYANDGTYLELKPAPIPHPVLLMRSIEFNATSTVLNPSQLEVKLDARMGVPANQQIALWDYVAGGWAVVDSRATTGSDILVTLTPTSAARFVGPNGEVRLRLGYQVALTSPEIARIDWVQFRVR